MSTGSFVTYNPNTNVLHNDDNQHNSSHDDSDNIDFFAELKKIQAASATNTIIHTDNTEKCLISNEPLSDYYITLPCNHKFNYLPLLNACIENNKVQYKRNLQLRTKCPYCKRRYKECLPYNPLLEKKRHYNINSPTSAGFSNGKCGYIYKSGKNKGLSCNASSYYNLCGLHLKTLNKSHCKPCKKSTDTNKSNADIIAELSKVNISTITHDDLKKYTVVSLRKLAKINNKKGFSKLKKNDLISLIKS